MISSKPVKGLWFQISPDFKGIKTPGVLRILFVCQSLKRNKKARIVI